MLICLDRCMYIILHCFVQSIWAVYFVYFEVYGGLNTCFHTKFGLSGSKECITNLKIYYTYPNRSLHLVQKQSQWDNEELREMGKLRVMQQTCI